MFSNKSGFSLAETVVSLGLLCIAALIGSQLVNLFNNSTSYSEKSASFLTLQDHLRQRLEYEDECSAIIGATSGQNQGTMSVGALTNGTQQITIKDSTVQTANGGVIGQGQVVLSKRLKITSLRLTNVQNYSGSNYIGQVEVAVEDLNGYAFRPVSIGTVKFVLNGNSIDRCLGAASGVSQDICTDMGCVWNISGTPQCQCQTISSICESGEYLKDISASGVPNCVSVDGSCPPGQYLQGVNAAGAICTSLPAGPVGAPVDGVCGPDDGQTLPAAPTNLCVAGSPSAVTGSGPWNWSCVSPNGGINAACSASLGAGPGPGPGPGPGNTTMCMAHLCDMSGNCTTTNNPSRIDDCVNLGITSPTVYSNYYNTSGCDSYLLFASPYGAGTTLSETVAPGVTCDVWGTFHTGHTCLMGNSDDYWSFTYSCDNGENGNYELWICGGSPAQCAHTTFSGGQPLW